MLTLNRVWIIKKFAAICLESIVHQLVLTAWFMRKVQVNYPIVLLRHVVHWDAK